MPACGIFAARAGLSVPVVRAQLISAVVGCSEALTEARRGSNWMRKAPAVFLQDRGVALRSRWPLPNPVPCTHSSKRRYQRTDFTVQTMGGKPGDISTADRTCSGAH